LKVQKKNYFIYIFIFWYVAKIICSTTFETICGIPVDTVSSMVNYLVLTVCCFIIMILSTVFTVQMMSFFQTVTPAHLIGKVMSVILSIAMCAQPLGSAMYGVLFEACKGREWVVVLFAGDVSMVIAVGAGKIFRVEVLK